MVFVTDMVKDADGMVNICEVSYFEDGEEWADGVFESQNTPCPYCIADYCDAQVIQMVGRDERGYYLARENLNREYISCLFHNEWSEAFDTALLRMTWKKVPAYTVTIMGWEVPEYFLEKGTVKRTRLLDYSQMALVIELTNWPDISYYEDILAELANDGELPDLEDVEGPEEWEDYLNTLDKWVDAHLKTKAN